MRKFLMLALLAGTLITNAKQTGTTFLQQVHMQVGFGTHGLRATPIENAGGFYFARFEAPFLLENLFISVEPRRAAGKGADHDLRWSGFVAYRMF